MTLGHLGVVKGITKGSLPLSDRQVPGSSVWQGPGFNVINITTGGLAPPPLPRVHLKEAHLKLYTTHV